MKVYFSKNAKNVSIGMGVGARGLLVCFYYFETGVRVAQASLELAM